MMRVSTDVFVVGAGGAGMYAAIAAAREGADVIVADKSLISRGGATIMAQMTVASGKLSSASARKRRSPRSLSMSEATASMCAPSVRPVRARRYFARSRSIWILRERVTVLVCWRSTP